MRYVLVLCGRDLPQVVSFDVVRLLSLHGGDLIVDPGRRADTRRNTVITHSPVLRNLGYPSECVLWLGCGTWNPLPERSSPPARVLLWGWSFWHAIFSPEKGVRRNSVSEGVGAAILQI